MTNSPKSGFRLILTGFVSTFVAQIAVLAAFFIIYRIIGSNFGPEGVGEYSLVRRVSGLFLPLLILGLGVGIPRYIGMSQDKQQRDAYLKGGGLAVAAFALVFLVIINLFRDYFADLCFGSTDYAGLVLPFSLLLAGLVLHSVVYSYFRGRLWLRTFNILQIVNLGVVPLGILAFSKDITIGQVISLIGITTFAIGLICCLFLIRESFVHTPRSQLKHSLKELLRYSVPRVPGDFALAGLFSLGPIVAAHFASIQEVGYLSISLSLLNMIGMLVGPLSTILLPFVSGMIVQGKHKAIRENVSLLTGAVIQCFIFATVQLFIFGDTLIEYWLGSEFLGATAVIRITSVSLAFYAFHVAMRSILDATRIKPVNAINLFISLAVFSLVAGAFLLLIRSPSPIIGLSVAFTSGLICLGALTYYSVRKIYPQETAIHLQYLWIAIAVNVLLGGVALLAKPFVISRFYYPILFEVFLGAVYLLSLWSLKVDWIRQIPKKLGIKD